MGIQRFLKQRITINYAVWLTIKCAVCGIGESRFVKEREAKGLLSNLGIKTPLNEIPLLGYILF